MSKYENLLNLCIFIYFQIIEISSITEDNIEFCKGKGSFPCDMSVLDINELDWAAHKGALDQSPLYILDDGNVIYYRYVIFPSFLVILFVYSFIIIL